SIDIVADSIREAVDRQVKFSLKKIVKMEIRSDRIESRIIACSAFRLFIFTPKVPSKLENSFHFLEIQSIESKKPNQLYLVVDGKVNHFLSDGSPEDMDHIILHIGISLKHTFPSYPLERLILKLEVQPSERLKPMHDMMRTIEMKESGSCGGFTSMYQCMCDFHGLPLRDEVVWDIDTIYLSHDCRELRLQDFDHLNGKDLVPIIGALEHNTWFKQFNASNIKLTVEACNELIKVLKRNSVIEEVNLSNTGIKMDFIQKLSLAVTSNSGSQLNNLDLSNNTMEDKAIYHLLGGISHLTSALTSLDISKTGISTKCLNKVGEMLAQCPRVMVGLTTLKVNENGLKGEDFIGLNNFLAQPNAITYLDLSGTDCTLDTLCDPLMRGCPNLTVLKASRTVFTHKKSKDVAVPNIWKQFFASACCLDYIDFSSCRLPSEALKELLIGVSCNRSIKSLYLDISSNELGVSGASVLSSCIAQVKGIKTLDISNNGFDSEMKSVLLELAKNSHLKGLMIGRNFSNIKPKNMSDVMNAVVQMLQEETCHLESLSIADSKLKTDTTYLINALGSNNFLLEIDLSGNLMGDFGARMLAKALLINTKLQKIVWDRNNITVTGFEDIAEALKKNMTLKQMPIAVSDAVAAVALSPKKTEVALQKIESYLQRNNNPRRFASDQVYRLQQGFLISSTQQEIDKLIVQVEDTIQALRGYGTVEAFANELKAAESLIIDANKSKQLLPGLQDISLKSQSSGNIISQHLNTMSLQLTDIIKEHLQHTTEEMLSCAKLTCPSIMADQNFHKVIQDGCHSKLSSLRKDLSRDVLEGASTDIFNATSELNLSVAALISDSVVEEVIDALTATYKSLSNHLCLRKSGLYQVEQEQKTVDVRQEVNSSSVHENPDELSSRRKTVIQRKQRPQSAMGEVDGVTVYQSFPIKSVAEFVLSNKITSEKVPEIEENSIGSTNEFTDISAPAQRLEHITKARPKREKAHRPTRPIHLQGTTEMEDPPLNGPLIKAQLSHTDIPLKEQPAIQRQPSDIKKKPEDLVSKIDKKGAQKLKEKEAKEKETKKKGFGSSISSIFKMKDDKKAKNVVASNKGQVIEETQSPDVTAEIRLEDSIETPVIAVETQPVEKLLPPSRNKHVLHDRVAILPPSSKRVETSAVTLAEEEDFTLAEHRIDSKEDVEKKEDISKIPAGAVKHGLSGQLMQEMKDKRLSKLLIHSPEDVRNGKLTVEANNNEREADGLVKEVDNKMPLLKQYSDKPPEVSDQTDHSRKLGQEVTKLTSSSMKRPLSSLEEHEPSDSIPQCMTVSTPELSLTDGAHPKPRPPPPPKPPKRNVNTDQNKDVSELEKSPVISTPNEGIVYDSATLRLPVKEKIKRISQAMENRDSSSQLSHSTSPSQSSLVACTKDSLTSEELNASLRSSNSSSSRSSGEQLVAEKQKDDLHKRESENNNDEIMV
ncbi:leucine-rich repeat-containing protein 16A, partial [Biomphalaria glabrata]